MTSALAKLRTSRPADVVKAISFGGGQGFERPPFWSNESPLASSVAAYHAHRETIGHSFGDYVRQAYKSNGIVFACVLGRMLPFSEARFMYQELNERRPGKLTDGPGLELLDAPWPNGTTGELLARMEQDVSLGGNFYAIPVTRNGRRRLRRLRPDWVTIISGLDAEAEAMLDGGPSELSAWDVDAEILAYVYHPKLAGRRYEPVVITPDLMVHWSPIPDPETQWRGMSWLTPVLRDIDADNATTDHKLKFFVNGATPQVVVSYDKSVRRDDFEAYVAKFTENHQGVANAYRTLHLGGGADATVVGADLKQLDFKATQGAGETRIAAASGVGAIIARFSEGLAGSSLNQGNYSAAKRQVGDMLLRPQWRTACAALSKVSTPPPSTRLWFDDDIPFLQEDAKDRAEITARQASTIRQLFDAGFKPISARDAVMAHDMGLLEHTGLPSVQNQPAAALPATPSEGADD